MPGRKEHDRGGFRTSDYDFDLPESSIAQSPAGRRDESRLMVVDREEETIEHRVFRDLPSYLRGGDALVLNTTRVFRARLLGTRDSGAAAEVLLLRALGDDRWEAMVQPGSKLRPGRRVTFAPHFHAEILDPTERGTRVVHLSAAGMSVHQAITTHGHIPLPPYIHRSDTPEDAERYQTVFAREEGSVAAPTAGLHFTSELLGRLAAQGVRRAEVLLHVGAGTFKPVDVEDPADHVMHEEWFDIPAGTAALLDTTRAAGGRICAVGTTTLRTLESAFDPKGTLVRGTLRHFTAGSGETRIFLRPPVRPRAADLLVTNLHLPRSTLLMLVAAFAGFGLTMHAYHEAIREGYRFYSYGDAMLIL